jgi:hypothetical protein
MHHTIPENTRKPSISGTEELDVLELVGAMKDAQHLPDALPFTPDNKDLQALVVTQMRMKLGRHLILISVPYHIQLWSRVGVVHDDQDPFDVPLQLLSLFQLGLGRSETGSDGLTSPSEAECLLQLIQELHIVVCQGNADHGHYCHQILDP